MKEYQEFDVYLYAESHYYVKVMDMNLPDFVNIGKIQSEKYNIIPNIECKSENTTTLLGR